MQKYIAMRFLSMPEGIRQAAPYNRPTGAFLGRGTQSAGHGRSNPFFYCPVKSMQNKKSSTLSGRGMVVEPCDFIGWEKNTILQP